MAQDDRPGIPRVRTGPMPWFSRPLRTALEQKVSQHLQRPWRTAVENDLSEFACHKAAVVSDGSYAAFFKYSEDEEAQRQFEIELAGLRTLSDRATVLIPEPIGIAAADEGRLLILKALQATERGPRQSREIGKTLARIHRVKGESFGFETDGFWGPLPQDNTREANWMTFFGERRLQPLLKIAIDSGNLPAPVISDVESVIDRLPDLCGPETTPSLLHGDAQQNNFISTAEGTYVIDPAVFFGNPEWDLAMLDAWQPVPDEVFKSYSEVLPIDHGFYERRDLWRIPLCLAAVALEGEMHLKRLEESIGKYR